ncbi:MULTISPECIES: MurR/RpiR family transcriptional regulator [unclassified Rhizobium]|uniref:MurR/RpiR family transcriptional regulator n=1 Tax=unclassified Rhizobium TaxID=2613769 RepID=UPI0009E03B1C|nr:MULTISPECIES: MurR/RpiR family transcriptional regulator [unclassified Rhizobium]MBO9124242.1 MurR/RpiR family transcriptional regulator [Rhizobium sp. 16-488-2b]MBO9174774.1 MurR/RpiR family transcriptional regulator [Rhizobium sp. 16-488-2a]
MHNASQQPIAPTDFASFKQMIAARVIVFSGLEERVARLALDKPEAIAFGTLQSVAKECAVGRTTVFRVAQATGFDGFADFKTMFVQHVRSRNTV